MKKNYLMFQVVLILITGFMLFSCDNELINGGTTGSGVIDYTLRTQNGVLHKQNTTIVVFEFNQNVLRNQILLSDVVITGGTAGITMISLQNSPGYTRMLTITVQEEGSLTLKINKAGFIAEERTTPVYKKLGLLPDNTVNIGDIVKLGGTPEAGPNVTYARYDGDPVAILAPLSYEPFTSVTDSNYALDEVLVTFNPPLDLVTNTEIGKEFRWFDMIWEGFADRWEFENESTSGSITSKEWVLHQVHFQLDLTTSTGNRVRFWRTSETNTTTGDKNPVRFLPSNIQSGPENTSWGNGHLITEIKLTVRGIQLRSPSNNAWPTINEERNANFEDMWIVSLSAYTVLPPPVKVLYSTTDGWHSDISNPRWGYDDTVNNNATTGVAFDDPRDGIQNSVRWNPIDITVTGSGPYTTIVVSTTQSAFPWYGYGSVSLNQDDEMVKNMNFSGSGPFRIPLSSVADYGVSNYFNPEKFIGFFIQGNAAMTALNITEIRIE